MTGWLRSGCRRCAAQRRMGSAQHGAAEARAHGRGGGKPCTVLLWSPMRAAKLIRLLLHFRWGRTQGLTASGVACCMLPRAGAPVAGHALDAASGWDYLVHGVVLAAGPRPLRMCLHAAVICGTGLRNCSARGPADVYARPLRVVLGAD